MTKKLLEMKNSPLLALPVYDTMYSKLQINDCSVKRTWQEQAMGQGSLGGFYASLHFRSVINRI
jgi:translation elongation factor EF-4